MRILFLDDDPNRLSAFEAHAMAQGHDLALVTTPEDAIGTLRVAQYDIVSLDHDLYGKVYQPSDDKSGFAVCQFIATMPKQHRPKAVICHSFNEQGVKNMVAELDKCHQENIAVRFGEDRYWNLFKAPEDMPPQFPDGPAPEGSHNTGDLIIVPEAGQNPQEAFFRQSFDMIKPQIILQLKRAKAHLTKAKAFAGNNATPLKEISRVMVIGIDCMKEYPYQKSVTAQGLPNEINWMQLEDCLDACYTEAMAQVEIAVNKEGEGFFSPSFEQVLVRTCLKIKHLPWYVYFTLGFVESARFGAWKQQQVPLVYLFMNDDHTWFQENVARKN